MGGAARLAFEGVACLRGQRLLFEDLSFALGPGEAALVTGPNGAGKSSLLRLAAGLAPPAAGAVRHEGRIAWMGEAAALDPALPLRDALAFWAALSGAGPDAVDGAIDRLALDALARVPVRLLSTGQRRRAAFARVLMSGAGVWLLDEPGNGLDAAALDRLGQAMAEHRAAGGLILAATHQPLLLPGATEIAL